MYVYVLQAPAVEILDVRYSAVRIWPTIAYTCTRVHAMHVIDQLFAAAARGTIDIGPIGAQLANTSTRYY